MLVGQTNLNFIYIFKNHFKFERIAVHATIIMIMALRNDIIGITFGTIFFQLMNDKNIDSQSESPNFKKLEQDIII